MRRHLRLNRERQFERGASLPRSDPRQAARPHRFEERKNFQLQRLARRDLRFHKAQARRGATGRIAARFSELPGELPGNLLQLFRIVLRSEHFHHESRRNLA